MPVRWSVERWTYDVGRTVDEGPPARLSARKVDRGDRPQLGSGPQPGDVDVEVVALDGQQTAALGGFGGGE